MDGAFCIKERVIKWKSGKNRNKNIYSRKLRRLNSRGKEQNERYIDSNVYDSPSNRSNGPDGIYCDASSGTEKGPERKQQGNHASVKSATD